MFKYLRIFQTDTKLSPVLQETDSVCASKSSPSAHDKEMFTRDFSLRTQAVKDVFMYKLTEEYNGTLIRKHICPQLSCPLYTLLLSGPELGQLSSIIYSEYYPTSSLQRCVINM